MNRIIETVIQLNATKQRDKALISNEHLRKTHIRITNTSENINIREIDIDTSEYNDDEIYNSPSCYITLDNKSNEKYNNIHPLLTTLTLTLNLTLNPTLILTLPLTQILTLTPNPFQKYILNHLTNTMSLDSHAT